MTEEGKQETTGAQAGPAVRRYGEPPYKVALVHGGPGARGEMAPVARALAARWGVLEPLQAATTLAGQVAELLVVLEEQADLPVSLVGFSWGAWLSYLVAAEAPALVRKLILVGSGPYEAQYVAQIGETRQQRLSAQERATFARLLGRLRDPKATEREKSEAFARLGELVHKTDYYDPLPLTDEDRGGTEGGENRYHGLLEEAMEMRARGELLARARDIECPVLAIHGDYDPHPVAGVAEPLGQALDSFRLVLLEQCGHKPWIERQARAAFYRALEAEL